MAASLDELVQRADLDGLVRHVDDTCASRDWDHLLRVRDAARAAVSTGRQLWPIATLANYRLALWAPAHLAVRALDDTARTFMPGPVSEILAVHHTWDDLEPHLEFGHDRSLVAYERALRGDTIDFNEHQALEIPFSPGEWEPKYQLAGYNDDGVVDEMPMFSMRWESCMPRPAEPMSDAALSVFAHMMSPWTTQSEGSARAVVVEGDVEDALGALGAHTASVSPMTPHDALLWLAWAGSSGGAHGKRRGVATGRSEALWFLSVFTGLDEDWPDSFDELGDTLESLNFYAFTHDATPTSGWMLNLMIEDPDEGLTVALSASDHV